MNTILKRATADANIKDLAFDLGRTTKSVGDHINGSVKMSILDKIEVWLNYDNADVIIKHLCEKEGGFFVKDIIRLNGDDFTIIPKLLKEFSEYLNTLSESLLDGKVTKAELTELRKEWQDVNSIVQGLFIAFERGDYDG